MLSDCFVLIDSVTVRNQNETDLTGGVVNALWHFNIYALVKI